MIVKAIGSSFAPWRVAFKVAPLEAWLNAIGEPDAGVRAEAAIRLRA